ncbi:DUF3558 domain-containing protein [Nocardia sp. NPDC051750]|uniref:DUF3558 domain-containing protein n=1 Tax=Nocardia sp. NPDC051750 TaxID=3364325 RepID=UPI0037A99C7B
MTAVRAIRGMMCGAGIALLVAGCGTDSEGTATPVTTTTGLPIAAEAPSSFDPCTDIPPEILASESLVPDGLDSNVDGGQGIKWRGCGYVAPDSYAVGITTTNLTLPVVRDNDRFVVRHEYTVDGRAAMAVDAADDPDVRASCTFYVEMAGGSLELSMDNPASNDKTGHLDTCGLALGLAEKVAPLIPDA